MVTDFEPVQPPASVAMIVALNALLAVGVPDNWPFDELIDNPVGRPVADHAIAPLPPPSVYVDGVIAAFPCRSRDPVPFTVMAGQVTLRVKFCVKVGLTPLFAVRVTG